VRALNLLFYLIIKNQMFKFENKEPWKWFGQVCQS